MTNQSAPETPLDQFVDLPLQPTGSGVADLEIAFEQMKLAEAIPAGRIAAETRDDAQNQADRDDIPGRRARRDDGEATMELVRMPIGEPAEMDTDCIRVEELADGRFRLTGTALCTSEDEGASVSLMNGLTYATCDEAEAEGVAWADSVGVRRLHISMGTRDRPLRLTEIDLPG